jgi:CRP/FNR family transcriptional regulator, dissimilatory nitrate respiration regulator
MRREPEIKAFLAHLPLFEGLQPEALERLAAGTTRRALRRGETLFRVGEPSSGFYAVVHGRVKLAAPSPQGRERVSAIVDAGRSFGEAIMFLEKPYIVGAVALGDALVLHIAKETIFAELGRNPGFARRVIRTLAAKLHASVRELDSYALGSGGRRFVAWLLRSVPAAERGAVSLTLPAAKRAIASQLNLSAEHLSRILRELALEGLLEVRGREVRIPDAARLRLWLSKDQGLAQGRQPRARAALQPA